MEWLMMNAYGANAFGENLGYYLDNSYIVADECEDTLMEMIQQLEQETPVRFQFRRQLASMEVMQKDLVPLLMNLEMDENANIFYLLMNALMELTQPTECLQERHHMEEEEEIKPVQKIVELSKLMYDVRHVFMNEDLIRKLFAGILTLTDQEEPLTEDQCRAVMHFYDLIRNLLYTSASKAESESKEAASNHCLILRNLLVCGLGDIIIKFLNIPQWNVFCGSCVQLMSLMYKDLKYYYEDSSQASGQVEQNPNNEYEHDKEQRVDDQADLDYSGAMKGPSTIPEVIGLIRCMENLMSDRDTDTDSNQEYSHNSTIPSHCKFMDFLLGDQDLQKCDEVVLQIREHLLSFTKTFFQKGFSQMVLFLLNHNAVAGNSIDEMYLLWLVANFLSFARRKKVDFECVRVVFLHEVVGMIIFQGLKTWTNILQKDINSVGNQAYRWLHLVVTALAEIFECLRMYLSDPSLPDEWKAALQMIKYDLSMMKEIRQFLVLSLRAYQPKHQDLTFLSDLIRTNHLVVEFMDQCLQSHFNSSFPLLDHVKQFGSKDIMRNYGTALSNFNNNTPDLNTAILTMMHHISGDCGKPTTLIQMNIISAFVKLCDSKFKMSPEVNDLIEYVFKIFLEMMSTDLHGLGEQLFGSEHEEENKFTEVEKDLTISLYMESIDGENLVQTVTEKLQENGVQKTEQEVAEFLSTMGFENPDEDNGVDQNIDGGPIDGGGGGLDMFNEKLIKNCADKLREDGLGQKLHWIQSSLLDVCYSKMILSGMKSTSQKRSSWEPLSFFCSVKNADIPLLQYNDEQVDACKNTKLKSLLASMQFRLPCSSLDSFYIPASWSVQELWSKASLIGPIDTAELKFSVEAMEQHLSIKQEKFTSVESNSDSGVADMSDSNNPNKVFWPAAVNRINQSLDKNSPGT